MKLFGNVDLREVTVAFRQSDRITEIFVEEGDPFTTDNFWRNQAIATLGSVEKP